MRAKKAEQDTLTRINVCVRALQFNYSECCKTVTNTNTHVISGFRNDITIYDCVGHNGTDMFMRGNVASGSCQV